METVESGECQSVWTVSERIKRGYCCAVSIHLPYGLVLVSANSGGEIWPETPTVFLAVPRNANRVPGDCQNQDRKEYL